MGLQLPVYALIGTLLALYYIARYIELYIARQKIIRKNGCKPPKPIPQGERVVGLMLLMENLRNAKEHRFMDGIYNRFKRLGVNTFSSTVAGENLISTTEPENVKHILAIQFKDFDLGYKRYRAFYPLLGNGIFTLDGAAWEHSRAMVRPNFTRSLVSDLDTFEVHIQNLINLIPKDGSTVDLQELFFMLTLDSATDFLFGQSVDSLLPNGSVEGREFADAFNYSQNSLLQRIRMGPFFRFYRDPKFNQACKVVHAFVDKFVARALEYRKSVDAEKVLESDKNVHERYIFLNELAKETDNPRQIRDQLLNILLAGRDTTASLLSHTFHTISKRPDIWEKLCAEVAQFEGRRPTYEELRNMKYLKHVLNESLRLYPVVPGNSRLANKDTTLPVGGGPDGKSKIFVKKNQIVLYNVYAMHRRPDIWGPDVLEFKPERWEGLKTGWEYLPFNGGPRICIGQQFALTEASYTIVRICQEFKNIESRDPEPWAEWLTLTMASKNGAKVSLTPA